MDPLEQLARELGLPARVVRRIAARVSEGGHEGRYEDLGLIGMGSMGEVRRVRDRPLSRVLAMKIIRPEVLRHPSVRARFIEEAQATAQLQHPAIVPVHEMGYLPDGRVYFTMKQIEGRTLTEVIASHHAGDQGWSLQRLVDAFRRVCEGVAYAHARGVVHRDLKPDNVMIGGLGEVLVVDWGLARVSGQAIDTTPVQTDRSQDDALKTRIGTIAGTPVYMAPEQAFGQVDSIGPSTDVYALGAILYQLLSGRQPYDNADAREVLAAVQAGPPARDVADGCALPDELTSICRQAMARTQSDRFAHAGQLAEAVADWLEGRRKFQRAMRLVREAQAMAPEVQTLRDRAEDYRTEAARLLSTVAPWDPVAHKRPAWELEDEAARLDADAHRRALQIDERLQAALTHAPDMTEAHQQLAHSYRHQHQAAELRHDVVETRRLERLLRQHDDGQHATYLQGDGSLSLHTDPPGASVALLRYQRRDRRLVPVFERSLGETPLRCTLPMGRYLLVLSAPGRATIRYPLAIERCAHHSRLPPHCAQPTPVWLPPSDQLGPDDVYVPTGWFVAGGDPEVRDLGLPRSRHWVEGFVIQRFPVTHRNYLLFLNQLRDAGHQDQALRCAPRERSGGEGAVAYGLDSDGCFVLQPDSEGDQWQPDWPVFLVDHPSASAYGQWLAQRTGVPWRLPSELEWEKAGRGPDQRFLPWGDFFDPTFARLRNHSAGRPMPAAVGSCPTDESPYGVRDLAGGVQDWCAGSFVPGSPLRPVRGGGWAMADTQARLCVRRGAAQRTRSETLGFRLARSLSVSYST